MRATSASASWRAVIASIARPSSARGGLDRVVLDRGREERLAHERFLDQRDHVRDRGPARRLELLADLPPGGGAVAAVADRIARAQQRGHRLAHGVVDDEAFAAELHERQRVEPRERVLRALLGQERSRAMTASHAAAPTRRRGPRASRDRARRGRARRAPARRSAGPLPRARRAVRGRRRRRAGATAGGRGRTGSPTRPDPRRARPRAAPRPRRRAAAGRARSSAAVHRTTPARPRRARRGSRSPRARARAATAGTPAAASRRSAGAARRCRSPARRTRPLRSRRGSPAGSARSRGRRSTRPARSARSGTRAAAPTCPSRRRHGRPSRAARRAARPARSRARPAPRDARPAASRASSRGSATMVLATRLIESVGSPSDSACSISTSGPDAS